jgi:hypothetical protein
MSKAVSCLCSRFISLFYWGGLSWLLIFKVLIGKTSIEMLGELNSSIMGISVKYVMSVRLGSIGSSLVILSSLDS